MMNGNSQRGNNMTSKNKLDIAWKNFGEIIEIHGLYSPQAENAKNLIDKYMNEVLKDLCEQTFQEVKETFNMTDKLNLAD